MAAETEERHTTTEGRTWRNYFPNGDLWVFGYGSLIWKPPPHYDQRVPGYISGYVRRFWQASTDHRGTTENPGRVVTVIEREFWETLDDPLAHLEVPSSSSKAAVWGAAYHIPASHAEEVHDYLDDREIDGYTVHYTPFYPTPTSATSADTPTTPITCMVYIGLPTNPQFLREPADREPQSVADVISTSCGKSGRNAEYLYLLEKALDGLGLGSADVHVTDLVGHVRAIEKEAAKVDEEEAEKDLARSLSISNAEAHEDLPRTE
ncbi:gamma-glutamylcyclotransferase [Aspergillus ruber CBS 135680]|uniref:glutathione-specific gamma-glutamylcyclotransferase n=1 Tax=Aspergillus ruber (strain CBS 135680) TaxID=1388766 RepID=A0A017SR26_ASPRC|nr:ChaC-domain-containing protein [Aspergillus ruber CBS 135680]EYE99271.1 ChaC-domain-containing protein [Aspergillus ruber CBS 135680]